MPENKFNKEETVARCVPMSRLQSEIGGKWKILILWYVSFYKVHQFGELMLRLDGITQSTLPKQLRELENDGFLHREIYKEIPPKVEYSLTAFGESFIPVLQTMIAWSENITAPITRILMRNSAWENQQMPSPDIPISPVGFGSNSPLL